MVDESPETEEAVDEIEGLDSLIEEKMGEQLGRTEPDDSWRLSDEEFQMAYGISDGFEQAEPLELMQSGGTTIGCESCGRMIELEFSDSHFERGRCAACDIAFVRERELIVPLEKHERGEWDVPDEYLYERPEGEMMVPLSVPAEEPHPVHVAVSSYETIWLGCRCGARLNAGRLGKENPVTCDDCGRTYGLEEQ